MNTPFSESQANLPKSKVKKMKQTRLDEILAKGDNVTTSEL